MSLARHGEIYRSDVEMKCREQASVAHSRRSSASMSLQPAIPWQVALQQRLEGVKKSEPFCSTPFLLNDL